MADTKIPIAYITKWAATRGIVTRRDAEASEGGYLYTGYVSVSAAHWTADRSLAEERWRTALNKAAHAAERKAARLRQVLEGAPVYARRATEGE